MDFRQRAQNALDRDEPGRALMILVNGLRRQPERDEAVDFFLTLYVEYIQQPGLEAELLRGLEYHEERGVLLRLVIEELWDLDKTAMANALATEAEECGIEIATAQVSEMAVESGDGEPEKRRSSEPASPKTLDSQPATASNPGSRGLRENSPPESIPEEVEPDPAAMAEQPTTSKGDSDAADLEDERSEGAQGLSRPSKPKKRKMFAVAVGVLVGAVTLCVAIVGWKHARDVQRHWAMEEAMVTFDPLRASQSKRVLHEARRPGGGRDVEERLRFIDALLVLDGVDDVALTPIDGDTDSAWGLGAQALRAAHERRWEDALRFSYQLEHTEADSLPAQFVAARLCEARRQWDCAAQKYDAVQTGFEAFRAAYTGAIRVAAMRYDESAFYDHIRRLSKLDDDHGYLQLKWVTIVEERGTETGEPGAQNDLGADRFVRQWETHGQAVHSMSQGRSSEVFEQCEAAHEQRAERFAAHHVLCAQAAALAGELEQSRDYLRDAVAEGELSRAFYRHVQILGPQLLAAQGRPDWGMEFVVPMAQDGFEGEVSEDVIRWEEQRSPHLPAVGDATSRESREAILVRAQLLTMMGYTGSARRVLETLKSLSSDIRDAHVELVFTYLVDGDLRLAQQAMDRLGEGRIRQGLQAYIAFLEGRHAEAHRFRWEPGDDPRLLRAQALAFVADGRGRDAMAALSGVEQDVALLSLRPTHRRVMARAGQDNSGNSSEATSAEAESVTRLDFRIDRAGESFWRRDPETSAAFLEPVLEVASGHPEAHWKMGLVRRVLGDDRGARQHFRRAWRGDEDSTHLLVESGRVHLEYGRYDSAREVFLRAVLRERQNVEAVQGLGQAYDGGDRRRGRRDLNQLLDNYSGVAGEGPARSEMKRWLAILHGSREGESEAYQYLERARDVGGERAVILIEFGRFYAARGEWDEARDYYGKALRREPTLSEVHLRLAQVAWAQGDRASAREHLDRLWRLVPLGDVRQQAQALVDDLEESDK